MKIFNLLVILTVVAFFNSVYAAEVKPFKGSAQFEQMKQLLGTWQGSSDKTGDEPVFVRYELKSAGSSILETLFPGKPYEMISIYTDNGGILEMTHFCAHRNQPTLSLIESDKKTLKFDYSSGKNINVNKDTHMHALEISFEGNGRIRQKWTEYEKGSQKGFNVLSLSRVQ